MEAVTTFGVKIDPSKAISGAKAAANAAKRMAESMGKSLDGVSKKSKKTKEDLTGIGQGAKVAGKVGNVGIGQLASGLGILDQRLYNVVNLMAGFGRGIGGAVNSMRNFGASGQAAALGMKGLGVAALTTVGIIGTVTVVIGALLAVILPIIIALKLLGAAFGFVKDGVQLAGELEQVTISLAVMTGSVETANKAVKEMVDFSNATPFKASDIVGAGKKLIAFGGSAETVVAELKTLGTVAAASGKDINELAELFGKARVDGRVMAEDLNQFLGAGIPIIGALAGVMKVTSGEIRKMASDGKIAFSDLQAALESLGGAGGSLDGLLEAQSKSYLGLISTIQGKWEALKVAVGEPFKESLKPVLAEISDGLDRAITWATDLQPAIQAVTDKVAALFVAANSDFGFKATLEGVADIFETEMRRAIDVIAEVMTREFEQAIYDFKNGFDDVMTPEFWEDLGVVLGNAARSFINDLTEGLRDLINSPAGKFLTNPTSPLRRFKDLGDPIAMKEPAAKADTMTATFGLGADAPAAQLPLLDRSGREVFTSPTGPDASLFGEFKDYSRFGERPADISLAAARQLAVAENPLGEAGTKLTEELEKNTAAIEANRTSEESALDAASNKAMEAKIAAMAEEAARTPPLDTGGGSSGSSGGRSGGGGGGGGGSRSDPLQAEADRIKKDIETPGQEYAAALANLEKLKEAGYLTSQEFSAASAKAADDYQTATDRMANATTGLQGKNRSAFQAMLADWGDLKTQADQLSVGIAQGVSGSFTSAIGDIVNGTKTAKEAFSDMAASILDQIVRMITQLLIQAAITAALGGVTGGVAGAAVPAAVPVAHGGGVIGSGNLQTRSVPQGTFRDAPRYHTGGAVGSNEQPAVLEKGETVLTRKQAQEVRDGMSDAKEGARQKESQGITIINVTDKKEVLDTLAENPDAVMNVISKRLPVLRRMVETGRRS